MNKTWQQKLVNEFEDWHALKLKEPYPGEVADWWLERMETQKTELEKHCKLAIKLNSNLHEGTVEDIMTFYKSVPPNQEE